MAITQIVSSRSHSPSFGLTGYDSVASYFCIGKAVTLEVAVNVGQHGMLEGLLNYAKFGI